VVIAAVGAFGVLSSSVGIGALPTTSLPVYGVTTGEGSRTTVAELGDVNGDGIGDYAVAKPYADANGTDSGIVIDQQNSFPNKRAFHKRSLYSNRDGRED